MKEEARFRDVPVIFLAGVNELDIAIALSRGILLNTVIINWKSTMASSFMSISCEEWRELSDAFPVEMETIMEMLIEAEADLCTDLD